jgi:hypothetical protein
VRGTPFQGIGARDAEGQPLGALAGVALAGAAGVRIALAPVADGDAGGAAGGQADRRQARQRAGGSESRCWRAARG